MAPVSTGNLKTFYKSHSQGTKSSEETQPCRAGLRPSSRNVLSIYFGWAANGCGSQKVNMAIAFIKI